MAACSAISRTRSATDLGSMTACPQVANLRYLLPKRKSGPKPTGQIRRSEQAVDYTRRIGRKQARVRVSKGLACRVVRISLAPDFSQVSRGILIPSPFQRAFHCKPFETVPR